MRSSVLAPIALFVAGAAALVAACGSGSPTYTTPPRVDGGAETDAAVDAAPPVDAASDSAVADSGPPDGSSPFPEAGPNDFDATPFDAGPPPFALRSPSFVPGAKLPCEFIATFCGGGNQSPAFTWEQIPAGTQSFAIVFTDETIATNHWVLYDIPANVTSLAAALERGTRTPAGASGAFQTKPPASFGDPNYGYFGPCPAAGPEEHTYSFTLYAEPVAHLAGLTAASTVDDAATAAAAAPIDSAALSTRASRVNSVPGGTCSYGG